MTKRMWDQNGLAARGPWGGVLYRGFVVFLWSIGSIVVSVLVFRYLLFFVSSLR